MNDDTVEEDQREQIRDGHEGIHAVGYVPHDRKVCHTAGKYRQDVKQAVDVSPALALQILHRTLSVIAPSEDGREGEGEQSEAQYERTDARDLREGHFRQLGAVRIVDVGIGDDAAYDDKSGERAYHYRIPEGAGRGNQSLAYGVLRACSSRNDRSRTKSGLVAEKTARNAVAGSHDDRSACQTAACRFRRKCRVHYQFERRHDIDDIHT